MSATTAAARGRKTGRSILAPDRAGTSLWGVSSAGGTPTQLTTLDAGEVTQRWPQVLPGGKGVLYTGHSSANGFNDANIVVQPLPRGTRKVLVRGAYDGHYIPNGHLVYVHDSTLFAMPFDLDRLEVIAPAVPGARRRHRQPAGRRCAGLVVAHRHAGVFARTEHQRTMSPIDWADRGDRVTPLRAAPAYWQRAVFSPDGQRLAMTIYDGKQYGQTGSTIGDSTHRCTADVRAWPMPPAPCGHLMAAGSSSRRSATVTSSYNLSWQRADGTGGIQRLTSSRNKQVYRPRRTRAAGSSPSLSAIRKPAAM